MNTCWRFVSRILLLHCECITRSLCCCIKDICSGCLIMKDEDILISLLELLLSVLVTAIRKYVTDWFPEMQYKMQEKYFWWLCSSQALWAESQGIIHWIFVYYIVGSISTIFWIIHSFICSSRWQMQPCLDFQHSNGSRDVCACIHVCWIKTLCLFLCYLQEGNYGCPKTACLPLAYH